MCDDHLWGLVSTMQFLVAFRMFHRAMRAELGFGFFSSVFYMHDDGPVCRTCHTFLVLLSTKHYDRQYITHQRDQLLAGMAL